MIFLLFPAASHHEQRLQPAVACISGMSEKTASISSAFSNTYTHRQFRSFVGDFAHTTITSQLFLSHPCICLCVYVSLPPLITSCQFNFEGEKVFELCLRRHEHDEGSD